MDNKNNINFSTNKIFLLMKLREIIMLSLFDPFTINIFFFGDDCKYMSKSEIIGPEA
jgi:hypothetical protein